MKNDFTNFQSIAIVCEEYYQIAQKTSASTTLRFLIDNELIRIILNEDQSKIAETMSEQDYAFQVFQKLKAQFTKEFKKLGISHDNIGVYIKNIKRYSYLREKWKTKTVFPSSIALFELLFRDINESKEKSYRKSLTKIISYKGEKPWCEAKAILLLFCDRIKQDLSSLETGVPDIQEFHFKLVDCLNKISFDKATSLLNRMIFQLEKELPQDFFDFLEQGIEDLDIDTVEKEELFQRCLDYRNALSILTDAYEISKEELRKLRAISKEELFENFLIELLTLNKKTFYKAFTHNHQLIKNLKENEEKIFSSESQATDRQLLKDIKQFYYNSRGMSTVLRQYLESKKVSFKEESKIDSIGDIPLSDKENYEFVYLPEFKPTEQSIRVKFMFPGIIYNNKEIIKTVVSPVEEEIAPEKPEETKVPERLSIFEPKKNVTSPKNEFNIGIDLGTSNSLLAFTLPSLGKSKIEKREPQLLKIYDVKPDEHESESYLLPSWIYYNPQEEEPVIKVGKEVKNDLWMVPQERSRCIRSFKKLMSENQTINGLTTIELSAKILQTLREKAESFFKKDLESSRVVITVPAGFGEQARLNTIQAIKLAGFYSELEEHFPLLDESAAICYAYLTYLLGTGKITIGGAPKTCLIYDHGGGTLNVTLHRFSVQEGNIIKIENIAVSRLNNLGGDYFDSKIAEKLSKQFFSDPERKKKFISKESQVLDESIVWGEIIKIYFSEKLEKQPLISVDSYVNDIPYILGDPSFRIDMKFDTYKELIAPIIRSDENTTIWNYRKFVESSLYNKKDNIIYPIIECLINAEEKNKEHWKEINKDGNVKIDFLILNGGMTKEFHVRKRVENFFQVDKTGIMLLHPDNPDQTVALGASLYNYFASRVVDKITASQTAQSKLEKSLELEPPKEVEIPIIPIIGPQIEEPETVIISEEAVDISHVTDTISFVYIDDDGKIRLKEIFRAGQPLSPILNKQVILPNIIFKDRMIVIPLVSGEGVDHIEANTHFSTIFFPVRYNIERDEPLSIEINASVGRNKIIDFKCSLFSGNDKIEELEEQIRVKDNFAITLKEEELKQKIWNNLYALANARNPQDKKTIFNKLQLLKMYWYISEEEKKESIVNKIRVEIGNLQRSCQTLKERTGENIKKYLITLRKLETFHSFLTSLNVPSPYKSPNISFAWESLNNLLEEYQNFVNKGVIPAYEQRLINEVLHPRLKIRRYELAGCFTGILESETIGTNIIEYGRKIYKSRINEQAKILTLKQIILALGEIGLNYTLPLSLRQIFAEFTQECYEKSEAFSQQQKTGKLNDFQDEIIRTLGKLDYYDTKLEKFLMRIINEAKRPQWIHSILITCRKLKLSKDLVLRGVLPLCKRQILSDKSEKRNAIITLSYLLSREKGVEITIQEIKTKFDVIEYALSEITNRHHNLDFHKPLIHLLGEIADQRNIRKFSSTYLVSSKECLKVLNVLNICRSQHPQFSTEIEIAITMIRADDLGKEVSGRLIEIRKNWETDIDVEDEEQIDIIAPPVKIKEKLSTVVTETLSVGATAWIAHKYSSRKFTSRITGSPFTPNKPDGPGDLQRGYSEAVEIIKKTKSFMEIVAEENRETFSYRNDNGRYYGYFLAKKFKDDIDECVKYCSPQVTEDPQTQCEVLWNRLSSIKNRSDYRILPPIYELVRKKFDQLNYYLSQQKDDSLRRVWAENFIINLSDDIVLPSTFFPIGLILDKILRNAWLGGELLKYQGQIEDYKASIVIQHYSIPLMQNYDRHFWKADYIISYWIKGCQPFGNNKGYERVLSEPEKCDFIEQLRREGFYLWGDFLICSVNPETQRVYVFDTATGHEIEKERKEIYQNTGIIPLTFTKEYGVNYLFSFPFVSDPNENPIVEGVVE